MDMTFCCIVGAAGFHKHCSVVIIFIICLISRLVTSVEICSVTNPLDLCFEDVLHASLLGQLIFSCVYLDGGNEGNDERDGRRLCTLVGTVHGDEASEHRTELPTTLQQLPHVCW